MENIPDGIIMILHQGYRTIEIQECIDAMPESWQKLQRISVLVSYSEQFEIRESYDLNFSRYMLEHKKIYNQEIVPKIKKNKGFIIAYFGIVPIPLGIDFGHLFYQHENIEIFQFHHQNKVWQQSSWNQKFDEENQLSISALPKIDQKGIIHALVRLSISHKVTPEETAEILSNAAEIDYGLDIPDETIVYSKDKLMEIGNEVKYILDTLSDNRSGLQVIHMFAAIPASLAFHVGTKISPNIHPYIQTYVYNYNRSPKYSKAILVKKKLREIPKFTKSDKNRCVDLRRLADKELRNHIHKFCIKTEKDAIDEEWPHDLIPIDSNVMNEPFWSKLPVISSTGIQNDQCSKKPNAVEKGFVKKGNKWHIDDYFIHSLDQLAKNDPDTMRRAFRLLFFHEILHDIKHDMQNGRDEYIENFPKVLETADYQADVYAIINEYGFHDKMLKEVKYPKETFQDIINIIIETMWCFDNQGSELTQIPIRRLNRYLIWYWQLISIEKTDGKLKSIVKILEEKPTIELAGLRVRVENNMPYFDLNIRHGRYLEMAVFHDNVVVRKGGGYNFNIENLLEGVRQRDGERILTELRRLYPANALA